MYGIPQGLTLPCYLLVNYYECVYILAAQKKETEEKSTAIDCQYITVNHIMYVFLHTAACLMAFHIYFSLVCDSAFII